MQNINPFKNEKTAAKWQSWIMSKVETTSKVLLELTTRMNLGRQGKHARQALDLRYSPQAPSQSWKGYPQVKKDA